MELDNHTRFPAGIFRTVIDQHRIAASVLVRITFDIRDELLVPSAEQVWLVSGPPWEGPQGPMDSDEVFYKGGVDLFLFAHARAPGRRPVRQMEVRIAVGEWQRTIRVTGERAWVRGPGALQPTVPLSFVELPLTLANAYGGKGEWDGLPFACPDNEHGKGFFVKEEDAVGRRLPNIEDPRAPVTAWTDRPAPVGVVQCPMISAQRLRNGVRLDEQGKLVELRPTMFNAAFPEMILERVQVGDTVRVDGVLHEGPLVFRIPDAAPHLRLEFEDQVFEPALDIDQIGIEADLGRVFIAYRHPFRYTIHALQRRSCELFEHRSQAAAKGAPRP
jgi:hypothetical protein